MPRQTAGSIADIVSSFVDQLSVAMEQEAVTRAREAVLSAIGGRSVGVVSVRGSGRGRGRVPAEVGVKRGPGRPPGRPRKKPPIQLCPVPGCSNRAAPVFGMVCSKHKDLPKAEIRKFREQRRAGKGKGKGKRAA